MKYCNTLPQRQWRGGPPVRHLNQQPHSHAQPHEDGRRQRGSFQKAGGAVWRRCPAQRHQLAGCVRGRRLQRAVFRDVMRCSGTAASAAATSCPKPFLFKISPKAKQRSLRSGRRWSASCPPALFRKWQNLPLQPSHQKTIRAAAARPLPPASPSSAETRPQYPCQPEQDRA